MTVLPKLLAVLLTFLNLGGLLLEIDFLGDPSGGVPGECACPPETPPPLDWGLLVLSKGSIASLFPRRGSGTLSRIFLFFLLLLVELVDLLFLLSASFFRALFPIASELPGFEGPSFTLPKTGSEATPPPVPLLNEFESPGSFAPPSSSGLDAPLLFDPPLLGFGSPFLVDSDTSGFEYASSLLWGPVTFFFAPLSFRRFGGLVLESFFFPISPSVKWIPERV